MKTLHLAVACLAVAAISLVGAAPAAAATLAHFVAHPAITADGFAHAATMLSILAVPAPRALCGRPRADAPTDPKALIEEIQRTFASFREQNDKRLDQLEKRGSEDVITSEQVETINNSLTALTKDLETLQAENAAMKLGAGAGAVISAEAKAHSDAFHAWFRKGNEPANMRELEIKAALTTQSDPDGGFLVPTQMEGTIDRVLGTVSAVRGISRVINVSTSEYKKLVNMGGAGSGWVGEEEARPATGTPTLREIAINVAELYANPASTQTALDDSSFNVEQWLADEVSIAFAEKEGAAFVSGDGVKKPRGLLAYPTVDNSSYAWGSLGFVVTGAAAAFASTNPADALISLVYALKQGYRSDGTFLTSDAVLGTMRKFKDGQGNYLFQPPTGPEAPATLLGKPIVTDDNMPALGAGNFPVAFGNFKRGYLIVDRVGIRVLRDPYTNKPNVQFYTTKRVGGAVVNFEAIKLLKCST
jgi:HK97 family phage major capsid protein